MKVKNWEKFQHFKDRRPPWIKLYREILDDPEWHELDGEHAKILTMIWLIASEDDTQTGTLPPMKRLAFRLRLPIQQVETAVIALSHWLERDDIELISPRYQSDAPETETETETEKSGDGYAAEFSEFWSQWPGTDPKGAKAEAFSAWKKIKNRPPAADLIAAAAAQAREKTALARNGQFSAPFKHVCRWLKGREWENEVSQPARRVAI